MAFADLKNDFVFRRIFASHPDLLRGLLNDLLERSGEDAITTIEYLPSEPPGPHKAALDRKGVLLMRPNNGLLPTLPCATRVAPRREPKALGGHLMVSSKAAPWKG